MRKGFEGGFEGLYGLVRDRLRLEPLSGHVFIFCNKIDRLANHANRTEFHRSREPVAAPWAGASRLRFHGSKRPSDRQYRASSNNRKWNQRFRAGAGPCYQRLV
jgi:IS66 Orf2 like protein